MSTSTQPPILEACDVLPLMHQGDTNGTSHQPKPDAAKAKGKTAHRRTGDRFAVVNTFADFTMAGLTRAEIAVWLLLWRDTKPDGLARTSQVDLARRAGVNVRTVKRATVGLHRRGLLVLVHRGSLRQGPSTYRLRPLPPERKGDMGDTL